MVASLRYLHQQASSTDGKACRFHFFNTFFYNKHKDAVSEKEMRDLLQNKESELVEAKLKIEHLKSELATLKVMLDENDMELLNAKNKLKEVNTDVTELKILLSSKEDQLIQETSMLKQKEEHVNTIQNELEDTKLKYSEVKTVVERIA